MPHTWMHVVVPKSEYGRWVEHFQAKKLLKPFVGINQERFEHIDYIDSDKFTERPQTVEDIRRIQNGTFYDWDDEPNEYYYAPLVLTPDGVLHEFNWWDYTDDDNTPRDKFNKLMMQYSDFAVVQIGVNE